MLKNVTISDGVLRIGDYAFVYCENLSRATIGRGVAYVGASAFENCKAILDVHYNGTESEWNNVFVGNNNDPLLNANIRFAGEDTPETPPVEPEKPVHVPGDMNGDGEVNVIDVITLRRFIAGGYGIELQ